MAAAQLMGHWMDPNAAFAYEISIAVYLVIAMKWGRLKRDTLLPTIEARGKHP
jgi:hypothetical protein